MGVYNHFDGKEGLLGRSGSPTDSPSSGRAIAATDDDATAGCSPAASATAPSRSPIRCSAR